MAFVPSSGTVYVNSNSTPTYTGTQVITNNVSTTSGTGNYITVTSTSSTTGTNTSGPNTFNVSTGGGQLVVNMPPMLELKGAPRVAIGDALYETGGLLAEAQLGQAFALKLPDGSVLFVDEKGGYALRQSDGKQKIVRKGIEVREFNRYINAADLMEEFIRDLGIVGVKQDEFLQIPVELFINWLVVRAAEKDGDDLPADIPTLEESTKYKPPQCKHCGRFVSSKHREEGMLFCNADHYSKYAAKKGL